MDRLRSPETPLIENKGRLYVVVSFEMLRLGFWISNFGNWNFVTRAGEGGALSIVPQALAYKLDSGEVRLEGNSSAIYASSISVFEETGVTRRNYIQDWFDAHPSATPEEQHDLVRSDDCFFAATGISGGDFLRGVRYSAKYAVTHSLVLRGKTGTLRYVESYHNMDRLSKFSAVRY